VRLKTAEHRIPMYCICKDDNTVITQMDQILNRWKEYFCTILNSDIDELFSNHRIQSTATDRIQSTATDNQNDKEILSPSYEVCSINTLQIHKTNQTNS